MIIQVAPPDDQLCRQYMCQPMFATSYGLNSQYHGSGNVFFTIFQVKDLTGVQHIYGKATVWLLRWRWIYGVASGAYVQPMPMLPISASWQSRLSSWSCRDGEGIIWYGGGFATSPLHPPSTSSALRNAFAEIIESIFFSDSKLDWGRFVYYNSKGCVQAVVVIEMVVPDMYFSGEAIASM